MCLVESKALNGVLVICSHKDPSESHATGSGLNVRDQNCNMSLLNISKASMFSLLWVVLSTVHEGQNA